MSKTRNSIDEMLTIIKTYPYYSIGVAAIVIISIFYLGQWVIYSTPVPTSRNWAYILKDDLYFLSTAEEKYLTEYMKRHYPYYYLPSGITIGEAIEREKSYLVKQKEAAARQLMEQKEASIAAVKKAREEEKNQKYLDKAVSFRLANQWGSPSEGENRMVYLQTTNNSKSTFSSVLLFITFENSSQKNLFSELIDIEATIPPGKKFTGMFYPCGASDVEGSKQCNYFNNANFLWVSHRVSVTGLGKPPLVGIYSKSASVWRGPTILLSKTTNANIQAAINQAENYQDRIANSNQSESAQISDWDQAAQNYSEIERLREGQ
ncbi:hypothetical protein [Acidithiobacillus sp.]|uniref:hypothetical protein n=1 Tax=Acidithiobacillus sp. TaxID=1872118 RepID=UPI003D075D41